ncbi:hypothetical protein Taro_016973 [Colocasia esculenta]|uniref:Uncharacterized protein n=1 Tax=Colocasia esculenta TaxID=4460 RepID=A0A843ULT7_COLES|nr:hypothetical protein [Colocasia esculenta]
MAASTTAGDPAKDEMAEAMGRIVDVITGVQQNLLIYLGDKRFHSFVSLACLLLAIVFSWKVLRAEPLQGNRRRQQRRQVPSSGQDIGPRSNLNISSTGEVCSSSGDSRVQDVVDQFFQPIKLTNSLKWLFWQPTLGQLVRQRLCGGRKVTCQLLGVILEETNPEELQEHATVRPSVLEVLSEITKICDLYLMERVLDDQTEPVTDPTNASDLDAVEEEELEERVLSALSDAGVFTSCGLVREKVLFCDTENGRTSFVRQLEPEWHIETNPDVIHQLARFIKYQLHIAPNRHERVAANIFCAASLEQFFVWGWMIELNDLKEQRKKEELEGAPFLQCIAITVYKYKIPK